MPGFSLAAWVFLSLASFGLTGCGREARDLSRAQAFFERGSYAEAQEQLRGLTGEQAVELRGQVAEAQARRDAGLAEVARILEQAPGPPLAELERLLIQGPGRIDDKRVSEAIDAARSLLSDQYAEARSNGMRWPTAGAELSTEAGAEVAPPLAQQLNRNGPSVATAKIVQDDDLIGSSGAIGAKRVDTTRGSGTATESETVAAEALEPVPWREQLARLSSVEELMTWSLDRESAGELQIALAGLKRADQASASTLDVPEEVRELASKPAREVQRVEQRLALRKELTAAIQGRPSTFESLGVTGVEAGGIQFDGSGDLIRWEALSAEDWKALSAQVDLTWSARLGLAMEYLNHNLEARADKVLVRAWQSNPSRAASVFQVVAWYRDEPVPPGGYLYRNEHWHPAVDLQSDDALEKAEQLSKRLRTAGKATRDQVFAQLLALGREDLCREALASRWSVALERFASSSGRQGLEKLVRARQEIDGMRADILDRIQDDYEYPSDLSQPGAAARKQASQGFIDRSVRTLRLRLEAVHPVLIRPGLRAFSDEAHWLLAREKQLGLKESLKPSDVPEWALVVGIEERRLSIESFAWNAADRLAHLRDRAVRKRNAALFANNSKQPGERATSPAEVRLVEITNDYRVLLGRPALAWDPRLQAAAWDHSQYMSKTGDFGHVEKTPGRETTSSRLARRGYDHPSGENCTVDITGADAAHQVWLHSPGHHRNIVAAVHTQIACSKVANYWTQVFGSDTAFLEKLKAWFD